MATILGDFWRFLLFKPMQGNIGRDWKSYLLLGLIIAWIVGFGRTWDFDGAPWWLRSGVTSVFYTFALALLIWAFGAPLGAAHWSYRNVLLMVVMTAAPGIVYALPVERWFIPDVARAMNMSFLLFVAVWRMALFRHFLKATGKLRGVALIVAWLLPPTIIVAPLSVLGVLQAVAAGMGGVRETTAPHGAVTTEVMMLLALLSWIALPLLLIAYMVLIVRRFQGRRRERSAPPEAPTGTA